MPRFHLLLSFGAFGALALPAATAWSLQTPPPIVEIRTANVRMLIQWEAGAVRCEGGPAVGQPLRRPWNQLGWIADTAPREVTLGFAIDATGRAVSIARGDKAFVPFAEDVAPALAASRFAAGAPRRGCTITYRMRGTPPAQADAMELMSYTVHPLSGRLPEDGWARIRSMGGTCLQDPQPQPLVRVYPDFSTIPATAGVRDWSMVRYDLDASGKVRHPGVLIGTGNRALDAAALKAIRGARFTSGARTGCLYPYWRNAAILPAPEMPEAIRLSRVEGGNCPDDHGWAVPPQLRFPEPYRQRSIEGWAVVSYDVAPWGETGNLKVIAAQPADAFGTQAIALLRAARLPTSGQGYTGCVDRVLFKMAPPTSPQAGGEGGAPVPPA